MKIIIRSGDITGFDDAEVIDYEEEEKDNEKQPNTTGQLIHMAQMDSNRVPSGIEYVHLGNK